MPEAELLSAGDISKRVGAIGDFSNQKMLKTVTPTQWFQAVYG